MNNANGSYIVGEPFESGGGSGQLSARAGGRAGNTGGADKDMEMPDAGPGLSAGALSQRRAPAPAARRHSCAAGRSRRWETRWIGVTLHQSPVRKEGAMAETRTA